MAVRNKVKNTNSDVPLVWLVHPGAGESKREAELNALGYRVLTGPWNSREIAREKAKPPCAVVVDLSQSPSSGGDVAVAMRSHRHLVKVPFILVDGTPERVASVRALLPDVIESTWPRICAALINVRANPPSGGRQLSVFAAYEGKPLAEKLGIKAGTTVAVVNAPPGFRATLGQLPDGAKIHSSARTRDLTLWFARSVRELEQKIGAMKPHAASGRLWIIWRKGGSAESALNQKSIRKLALGMGLVDFRISRIDDECAGLRFTLRK